jgi:plasmid maintenance system antidote protein VapI
MHPDRINPEWLRQRVKASPFKQRALAAMLPGKRPAYYITDIITGRTACTPEMIEALELILDWGEMVYGRKVVSAEKML